MSKYSLDYDKLADSVDVSERRRYPLADVQDRIVRVAFDVVRFRDGDPEKLWQIQSSDEGDYIISLYEEEAAKKTASAVWSVVLGKNATDLHIFYKGAAIVRLAAKDLGVPAGELDLVKQYLPGKLATNKKLTDSLIARLDVSARQDLFRKYPELK